MNLSEIEKNKKFKHYIFSKSIWQNYAFVPPTLVLFGGLFGLLFLYQNDLLISWYSIPFIAIFTIGTIWFKSIRKYLINKKIKESDNFVICVTTPLINTNKNTLLLFTTNQNRHNVDFINKKKREILERQNNLNEAILKYKNFNYFEFDNNSNYLIKSKLTIKKNKQFFEDQYIVFVENSEPRVVPKHTISKFSLQKKQ